MIITLILAFVALLGWPIVEGSKPSGGSGVALSTPFLEDAETLPRRFATRGRATEF
jgi:hypothetical protein